MTKKKFVNPLDELFNTPPMGEDDDNDDAAEYPPVTQSELNALAETPAAPEKDEEDVIIDEKIDKVYELALDAFNTQTEYQEIIEPRYAARNAEVAANYLSIALSAANSRAKIKGDRKRNQTFVPFNNTGKEGVIVASREEIMRSISIDAETKEYK